MCQFTDRGVIYYTKACGHYRVYAGATEPCPEAESKTRLLSKGYASSEIQICDAVINKIERQRRSNPWSFHCRINGKRIEVCVASSGHCEVWKELGYRTPTFQQLSESQGETLPEFSKNEPSVVKSLTMSTPASSKDNPKVRLSARLKNWVAKEWNGFSSPKNSFPQRTPAFISGASEHDKARESNE